jgi:hypothetical protein
MEPYRQKSDLEKVRFQVFSQTLTPGIAFRCVHSHAQSCNARDFPVAFLGTVFRHARASRKSFRPGSPRGKLKVRKQRTWEPDFLQLG